MIPIKSKEKGNEKMKKIISFILVMILMMTLSMSVFAAQDEGSGTSPQGTEATGRIEEDNGCITINNVTLKDGKPVATYAIYQLLELKSFNFNSGSYTYSYSPEWNEFFKDGAPGADYFGYDKNKVLVWEGSSDAARVEEFAKVALNYAKNHSIQPTKSTANVPIEYTVEGSSIIFGAEGTLVKDGGTITGVKVSDTETLDTKFVLELGYYLVDSTVGSLCGLSTTNPHGIINSKNGVPTIDKQVQEDLTSQWGSYNSADIGQDVNFRTTIHVHDGAQKYILHDVMDVGLTFTEKHANGIMVKLVKGSVAGDGTVIERTETVIDGEGNESQKVNYTIKHKNCEIDPNEGTKTPHASCENECTFEIVFSDAFCADLETNDRLIIFYSAMLNRNAEIGNGDVNNPANENKTYLSYGEGHVTTEVSTVTKTYGIDLVKTDGQNKLLDGASFRIYSAETDGTEIAVVPLVNNQGISVKTEDGYNMYRRARSDERGAEIIVDKGKVRIVGLDNGVYWLEEINHPEGYDKIESRQKFTIADNNLDAIIANGVVSTNSGVHVVNHSGTMLPETGGVGTVMFITCGMIVVLGAGVLLVTKKRMNMIK